VNKRQRRKEIIGDFRIGDWVTVKAVANRSEEHRVNANGELQYTVFWETMPLSKEQYKRGKIVGLSYRQEGKHHPSRGNGEDYEQGYLEVTRVVPLIKVATSWTTTIEVYLESIERENIYDPNETLPIKPSTKWSNGRFWGKSRQELRDEMKKWPRDKKGRWLKEDNSK